MITMNTNWNINRNQSNERAEVYATCSEDNLENLSMQLGLDISDAQAWLKHKYLNDVDIDNLMPLEIYTVPNVWISANLMYEDDIEDRGIFNWDGAIGKNANTHKPDGVCEVIVNKVGDLPGKIHDYSGNIHGLVIYAFADESGYIYNSSKYLYGEKIHTSEIFNALTAYGNYKIAYASYLMPHCGAYLWEFQNEFESKREFKPDKVTTASYNVNWLGRWKENAVIVDSCSVMNP